MKIAVDLTLCQGYAHDAFLAPDVFRFSGRRRLPHVPAPAEQDHLMTHLSLTEGVPEGHRPETRWRERLTDTDTSASGGSALGSSGVRPLTGCPCPAAGNNL